MEFQKKLAAVVCAAVLALVCAACGTRNAGNAQSASAADFQTENSVIFEKDGVKVTTAGLDTDPTSADFDPIIWLDIENTGEQDVCLGITGGAVNGLMNDIHLIEFYIDEDGEYYGGNYAFSLMIPADSNDQYALELNNPKIPGVNLDVISEVELCFTTAEDEFTTPDYTSEPVIIKTGEPVETVDINALGTVVIDDENLTLVIGEQDYDDWFGPSVYVYVENKTENWMGLTADSADADGNTCDYIYYAAAVGPHKRAAGDMSFDDAIREMKGFENLTVNFKRLESDTRDGLSGADGVALEPVSVQYPPRVWGEYENGGLNFEIQPKYNDLITVEVPENDDNGILFSVSETASLEAGGHDGAGWLFSIGSVSETRLHEMLAGDMSGERVFAKDEDKYYIYYHATDVRYERATTEEMRRDIDQWTMLNEWAENVPDKLAEKNHLESVYYGNSDIDMYVARAAYMDDVNVTIVTTEEYGEVSLDGVDGTPYAEFVMRGYFTEADSDETPSGQSVVLKFPDEDVSIDFFYAPGAYARVTSGDTQTLYQAMWYDDTISYAEAMQGWYYAAAELAGIKPLDESLVNYYGLWYEQIAGRGEIEIKESLAPGKVQIQAHWPNSAFEMVTWEMTANPDEDGQLVYENGVRTVTTFDESYYGEITEEITDERTEESGVFYLNDSGELIWHDDSADRDDDSVFIRGAD